MYQYYVHSLERLCADSSLIAMLRYIVLIYVLKVYFVVSVRKPIYTGSLYVPTVGEVWPRPQKQIKYDVSYTFDPQHFSINIINETCELLRDSINRCVFNLGKFQNLTNTYNNKSQGDMDLSERIQKLQVELTSECEDYPHLGMDEAYTLTVSSISTLSSASIWGIIRGLETFTQLFFATKDYRKVSIQKTEIIDYPRFPHRGLLIDTSRHYLSLSSIFMTLKAMAINKMNVLHWHMTDDQSFPYKSEILPELSQGAFHSSMVYTKNDIVKIINYGRDRGIRILPEFDVPSHTLSWGIAFPTILAECYNKNEELLGLGIMNPTKENTYRLLRALFHEVQELFKDKYFHLGGDEINFSCWESNPTIRQYMKDNYMRRSDLIALFFRNTFTLLKNDSTPIVWQDVFDARVPLNFDTIVQIWKGGGETLVKMIEFGYHVLYSTKWYLDHPDSFDDFYIMDPRKMVTDITKRAWDAKHVIGGEACMWGERVDDRNLFSKVWPRTCAVAERLWSAAEMDYDARVHVKYRLEEHICRMTRRGIPLQPEAPGFCLV